MSIGESLADARRQAGLTVTQVSQQTRIRESIIRDIEQGDFAACGGDFYARGHIRSIAGAVGADPAPLISEYDADHGPLGSMRAADVFEPSKPIKIRERRSPSMTMIVVVVLLAIIGYAAYRLVSSHDNKPGQAAGVGAAATTSTHPSVRPTPSDSASSTPAARRCASADSGPGASPATSSTCNSRPDCSGIPTRSAMLTTPRSTDRGDACPRRSTDPARVTAPPAKGRLHHAT